MANKIFILAFKSILWGARIRPWREGVRLLTHIIKQLSFIYIIQSMLFHMNFRAFPVEKAALKKAGDYKNESEAST